MIKKNYFYRNVIVLVLMSSLILVACLYIIFYVRGKEKSVEEDAELNIEAVINEAGIDSPTPQTELEKKFSAMYNVIEGTDTIFVISKEYLDEYWESNYDAEVVKSLSIDEVLYIIQDSIRIYDEYETIIMPGFKCESNDVEITKRFPLLEHTEIHTGEDEKGVYDLIVYRITALSSPNAILEKDDKYYVAEAEIYYIADYKTIDNREFLYELHTVPRNFTDLSRWVDFFSFDNDEESIVLCTKITSRLVYEKDE